MPSRILVLLALGAALYSCTAGAPLESSPTLLESSSTTGVASPDTTEEIALSDVQEAIQQQYRDGVSLFEYERDKPLDIEEDPPKTTDAGYVTQLLSFVGRRGHRVEAMLVVPSSATDDLRPAMVIVDADSYTDELGLAANYAANLGFVVLMVEPPAARDTELPRPGLGVYTFTDGDRDDQIDFVVDLRRAIDLLETRADVDMRRIGVRAFGVGAETAALLSGVEDRVSAYNLINLVGGPVEFYTSVEPNDPAFSRLSPEERRAWLAAMEPIEPTYYISQATPAALLFQLEGEFFQQNAARLVDLASEPKVVDEVQVGEGFAADCRAAAWFAERFELSNTQLDPACP